MKRKKSEFQRTLHLGRLVCLLVAVASVDPATPELDEAISGSKSFKAFAFSKPFDPTETPTKYSEDNRQSRRQIRINWQTGDEKGAWNLIKEIGRNLRFPERDFQNRRDVWCLWIRWIDFYKEVESMKDGSRGGRSPFPPLEEEEKRDKKKLRPIRLLLQESPKKKKKVRYYCYTVCRFRQVF